VPKFHCDLSTIEGVWAFGKNYSRRNNDVTSLKNFLELLNEIKEKIKEHILCKKLWRRFWNTIEAYYSGDSCLEVLTKFFSYKCKSTIQEHRKIVNTKLYKTLD